MPGTNTASGAQTRHRLPHTQPLLTAAAMIRPHETGAEWDRDDTGTAGSRREPLTHSSTAPSTALHEHVSAEAVLMSPHEQSCYSNTPPQRGQHSLTSCLLTLSPRPPLLFVLIHAALLALSTAPRSSHPPGHVTPPCVRIGRSAAAELLLERRGAGSVRSASRLPGHLPARAIPPAGCLHGRLPRPARLRRQLERRRGRRGQHLHRRTAAHPLA